MKKAPNLPEAPAPGNMVQINIVKLPFVFQSFISIKAIHVTVLFS